MNPLKMNQNRTARLVREARTPAYTSESGVATPSERDVLRSAEDFCGPDFCHVCGRATDHFGEHSDAQLRAWADSPRGRMLMGR